MKISQDYTPTIAARESKSNFNVAGLLFHDVGRHDLLITLRAILDAAQKLSERERSDPGEFLQEAVVKLAEDFYKRKIISDEEFDRAIQPLLFFTME